MSWHTRLTSILLLLGKKYKDMLRSVI